MSSSATLEDLAAAIISKNAKNGNHRACLVVAGGGGQAISALTCTPGASSLFLEGTVTYDQTSSWQYLSNNKEEIKDDTKFVSEQMAQALSKAALERSLQYVSNIALYNQCIGVACTSALVKPDGRTGRTSRGYICATMTNGSQWSCKIELDSNKNQRNRRQEDTIMSCLVLKALEQALFPPTKVDGLDQILQEGDDVQVKTCHPSLQQDAVLEGAQQIVSGSCQAILLVPSRDGFVSIPRVILPSKQPTLIFPGSFNPPHKGHLALAEAALRVVSRQVGNHSDVSILMEMSLTNPDKPAMDPREVSKRARMFVDLHGLPANWGLLLTSAPLFQQKVQLLRQAGNTGELIFVIGTDTMVRIIDVKYYDNSQENMLNALVEMKQLGVRYVVGGRLEQGNNAQDKFVSGQEELVSLPTELQDLFTLVREEDFRMDISSTEIRQQAQPAVSSG